MGTVIIRFTDQESNSIKREAAKDSRSINSWCKLTLLRAIAGTKTITSTITQGEALILQKRDDAGKFVKRSKRHGSYNYY